MKRSLIITNIPSPYMVDLIRSIQYECKDYETWVIFTSSEEDNRDWDVKTEGIKHAVILNSSVVKSRNGMDIRYLHIPHGLAREIDRINPDFIVACEYNPAALLSLRWAKRRKRKFISWTEGTSRSEAGINPFQKLSRKIIAHNADAFIACSTMSRKKLLDWGIPEEKIFLKLLTVGLSGFEMIQEKQNGNTVLFVGQINERKGMDLLMRALALVDEDYDLRVVGNGDRTSYESLASQLKIQDRITWVGYRSGNELMQEYANADCFVLPSRMDCFGLVILEAVAMGIPAVISKYAEGCYDLIEEGKNGYIVDPDNSEEMAKAIKKALTNPALRQNCYNTNREILEKFSYPRVIAGYRKALDYAEKH